MKYKVGDIVFSTVWKKDVIIRGVRPNLIYEVADIEYLSRFMYTHELNLKSREDDIEKDMEEHQKIVDEIMDIQGIEPIEAEMEQIIHCPEGYIFKDENGNVINATKIVLEKKKKEYPKTYEECCVDLGLKVCPKVKVSIGDTLTYRGLIVETFIKLLACRDAYLKRYEIEMKLNSRWTPDFEDLNTTKFCITTSRDKVIKVESSVQNYVLAFPTEEMRNVFYENFKELINECKELL